MTTTPPRPTNMPALILARSLARTAQAQREHDDAVALHGANSKQATATASALDTATQTAIADLASAQRASVVAPEVAAEAFALYGRVVRLDGVGLAGVRVRAESEIEQLIGEETTDALGAFVVRMPASAARPAASAETAPSLTPKATAEGEKQEGTAGTTGGTGASGTPGTAKTASAAQECRGVPAKSVFLSVLGNDGAVLYRDQASTVVTVGQAVNREIAVAAPATRA